MKVGVSYNVFDGEELLEGSIKSIRESVDYISVVYQTISNFGNQCDEGLVPLLERLKSEGLVDDIMQYKPKVNQGGHYNEISKRNLGLFLSEGAKCTHHMSMDTDEFYIKSQFEYMKNTLVEGDYDAAACQMRTYFKDPTYEVRPLNDYYVSLLFKIGRGVQFVMGHPFPVLVDPTRRMLTNNFKIFSREEIEMYHMSYIRKDIKSKLTNSSSNAAFVEIDEFLRMYMEYEIGDTFFTTKPPGHEITVLVDDRFKIGLL